MKAHKAFFHILSLGIVRDIVPLVIRAFNQHITEVDLLSLRFILIDSASLEYKIIDKDRVCRFSFDALYFRCQAVIDGDDKDLDFC